MKSMLQKVLYALVLVCLVSSLIYPSQVQADNRIVLTGFGTPYYQDFDSLSNTLESETLPMGWVLAETGTSEYANNRYRSSTGNLATGDTYSFGTANSFDRALGGIQEDNLIPLFGASFVNYAGGTVSSLSIAYTGEEWRLGKAGGRSDKIKFELSTDATTLNNGTWKEYEDLTFFTPNKLTEGIKDGNLAVNQTKKQFTVSGLSIAPGESFWIRWSDHNPFGLDDGLAVDDFSLTPFGSDNPPSLIAITPPDNAANVALDANISVTFSEPVNLSDNWISLSCSSSKQHPINVTGGPLTFVVDPVSDFVFGDSCTVTVEAANVSDQDTSDPPDALDKNYTFSFSALPPLDNSPIVTNTSPANKASAVLLDSGLTVHFSEGVSLSEGWFALDCSKSGSHAATVDGGPSIFSLSPLKSFLNDENCTLTINAQKIADLDTNDPPDSMPTDFTITFSTLATPDTAPYLSASIPCNDAKSVSVGQWFELTFNEPVTINTEALKITCDSEESFILTIDGGPTVFQVKPDRDFNFADRCSMTIAASGISDQDSNDPPDNMLMDQTIRFETLENPESAPGISKTNPEDGALEVALNTNITITFDEEVTATDTWAELKCSASGEHSFTTNGSSQVKEINPDEDFAANESCSLTILSGQIHDLDTQDPPDEMIKNYLVTFTTGSLEDQPPSVLETIPVDKAVDTPISEDLFITFSEPVIILDGGVIFSCEKSKKIFSGTTYGPIKYMLEFEGSLAYSEECTVTIKADKILDMDENDPPDFMTTDYTFSFITERSPEEIFYPIIVDDENTFPNNGDNLYKSFFHLIVQFSKDILHDGSDEAADNTKNYCLLEFGPNQNFDSAACDAISGDDEVIPIDRIIYNAQKFQADIVVNHAANLPDGTYRLIISGEHSIKDLEGNLLNNGEDTIITFTILNQEEVVTPPINGPGSGETTNYSTNMSASSKVPLIPVTGFRRGEETLLAPQLTAYKDMDDTWLEVPALDFEISITGVPKENGTWDVTWLASRAGWLEGSAFPPFKGNSVLTAHVWDALNQPGPFYGLEKLKYSEQVIIHAWGEEYVYEVREVLSVKPENVNAMMKHQERSWLTLVTCQGYDEDSGEYQKRILVRAVLVEVR